MLDHANLREVFPWNHSFETHIDTIDKQHKRLVMLLNQMGAKLAQGADLVEMDEIIDELTSYANYHFESEEKIWEHRFHEDDWFSNHHNKHSKFTDQINDFKKKVKSGKNNGLYEDILRFLIYWLAHHILDEDMRMAKALHAMDEGLDMQTAKARTRAEMSDSIEVFIDTLLGMYEDLSSRTLELERERKERIKITESLAQSKHTEREFGNEVINSVPGLVYLYDETRELVRWNKHYIDDLGYSDDDLKNMSPLDFFNKSEHKKIKRALLAISKGEQIELEANILNKAGDAIPYLLTGKPFVIDGKPGFLGTGINVTRLKRIEEELIQKTDEVKNALTGTIAAVSKAMETRDPYTAGHQIRVKKIAIAIAEKLGLDEFMIEGLELGASIHDIGKLAVPTEILVKPTKLTPLEYNVIQTHVETGADILKEVEFPWPIIDIIMQHHERLDGSGYPNGLKGDEICLGARIVAIADVFEAMSAHRPYRPSQGVAKAMDELTTNSGKLYDPEVVDALKELLAEDIERFE